MSEPLLAGFAVREITPPLGVTMAGFAARKGGATGVHDSLYTQAMVLNKDSRWVAVISMDLVEASDFLVNRVRQAVSTKTEIPADAILVGSTHNHSGPLISGRFGEFENQEVVDMIATATIEAVLEAVQNLRPVRMKVGSASVPDVAKNRRSLEPSPDPEVNFIGFYADRRLIGCLVNFPLHATVLGAENRQYTADYPGYLRRTIQEKYPDCCIVFLNGAAGNINIGYSADASALGEVFDFRTFAKAAEVGGKLGSAVINGLGTAEWVDSVAIEARECHVPLPLKELPSTKELKQKITQSTQKIEELRAAGAPIADISKAEVGKIYLECLQDAMLRRGIEGQRELAMPVQALRIGPAILVAIPGELFVELGLAIRQSQRNLQVFLVGYANGSWGYLPNRNAFGQGGYEVETSIFNENMGEALVDGASQLVRSLVSDGGENCGGI